MMEIKLQKMVFSGLCLLLFLAPWQIYFPVSPKITLSVAQLVAIIVFLIWLFLESWYGRNRKIAGPQFWPAVLILAMILSLTVAMDYQLSIKYLIKWSVPILLFFITASTVKEPAQVKKLIKIAFWAAMSMVLLGLLEFCAGFDRIFSFVNNHKGLAGVFTGPGALKSALSDNIFSNKVNWFYWMPEIQQYWVRPFGTFIAVSAFTLSTGLGLSFILVFYRENSHRIAKSLYLLAGFIFVATIILTFARSAWLGLIAILAVYVVLSNKRKKAILILLTAVIMFILAVTLLGKFNLVFKNRIASLGQDPSAQSRLVVWRQACNIIVNRPITGVGLANYDYGLAAFNNPSFLAVPAHNNYLQVWAETGILGLAALLMIILQGMRISFKTYKSKDVVISNLGLCFILMWVWFSIQGIFDTNIFDDKVSMLFWILAGVNAAVYKISKANVEVKV